MVWTVTPVPPVLQANTLPEIILNVLPVMAVLLVTLQQVFVPVAPQERVSVTETALTVLLIAILMELANVNLVAIAPHVMLLLDFV